VGFVHRAKREVFREIAENFELDLRAYTAEDLTEALISNGMGAFCFEVAKCDLKIGRRPNFTHVLRVILTRFPYLPRFYRELTAES